MLGGEQSGHIIFRKYAHTGDGLITAIMLMGVLIDTQLPLSVLAAEVKMYPQVLKNVKVDDKDGTLGKVLFGTPSGGVGLYVPESMLEDARNLLAPVEESTRNEEES